ncbi:MAG: (2Fe-2S)-binding protein [Proteobacteria bacterium]|nr:(2Fe-2S)-binding protein [Pseudomonadota bacterium]
MISFILNGAAVTVDVEDDTPLLWVLRDTIGLTGTKFGCGIGACGACTVHMDGRPVRTCVLPVEVAEGRSITTIEGLGSTGSAGSTGSGDARHAVQQAWIDAQVPQCGYCQSGMIMAAAALLDANPDPSDADIDAAITNICRCGTYQRVRTAIHAAARARRVE